MADPNRAVDSETIARNMREPAFVLDRDGTVVAANERFLAVADRSRDAVIGADRALFASIVEEGYPEFVAASEGVVTGEVEERRVELSMCHPEGAAVERRLPAEARVSRAVEAGSVVGCLTVLRDVSQRKRRERELERRNERLDAFARIVSHDLRNPLEVAQGRLELAREETDSEHLERATEALDRIESIAEHTLRLAQHGETVGETEPVDLATLARECAGTVQGEDWTLRMTAEPTVLADPNRLRDLLENLFRNAVEHGSTNPDSQAPGAVTVTVGDLDDGAGFYVADDGPGIPPELREQIFEPGYSSASGSGGTGFGLAIVREIVRGHGWEIGVTESSGGGTRFEISGVDRIE